VTGPGGPPRRGGDGLGDAYTVLGYLLGGLVFWGGVGYLLDRWLGTSFLVLIGLLVGGAAALYLIYVRYGKA
jgi:F0F1-type ATP synthase assembly protein I